MLKMLLIFFNFLFLSFFKRFYLFIFRQRGREGERGEKHQCVVASHAPLETWHATQACSLTRN